MDGFDFIKKFVLIFPDPPGRIVHHRFIQTFLNLQDLFRRELQIDKLLAVFTDQKAAEHERFCIRIADLFGIPVKILQECFHGHFGLLHPGEQ